MENIIPSLNFHLYEPCNMRCKFCFATFQDVKKSILPKGHLPFAEAEKIIHLIGESALFQKINFAGGEPTLHPHLPTLIQIAKSYGLTTSIVTNGTKLTTDFLAKNKNYLDWIALSIDSLDNDTNLKIGRAITGKTVLSEKEYKNIIANIQRFDYKLKINTVVNAFNYQENFTKLITETKPNRWKVLQVLEIEGENEHEVKPFLISTQQFESFVQIHRHLENITNIAPESNEQIKGSYIMINPAGQFFENIDGKYNISKPIHEVGVHSALSEIRTDFEKFVERKGIYAW